MGVNKVILLGRLGKDPDLRYTSQQIPVCNFTMATGERRKDASGNWVDHTEWHNIVAFGKQAELIKQYLKKGREVYVEGRIQTRKWQDKEGKDRYTTEIILSSFQFVGSGRDMGAAPLVESASGESSVEEIAAGKELVDSLPSADALAGNGGTEQVPFDDDDIPF